MKKLLLIAITLSIFTACRKLEGYERFEVNNQTTQTEVKYVDWTSGSEERVVLLPGEKKISKWKPVYSPRRNVDYYPIASVYPDTVLFTDIPSGEFFEWRANGYWEYNHKKGKHYTTTHTLTLTDELVAIAKEHASE